MKVNVVIADWRHRRVRRRGPVARQHPEVRDGAIFVTLEDEDWTLAGHISWPSGHAPYLMENERPAVLMRGTASVRDGAVNLIASVRDPIRHQDSVVP